MDLIALLTRGIQELYDMLGKVIQKLEELNKKLLTFYK